MKIFRQIQESKEGKMMVKVEKRLTKIKNMLDERNKYFQIDIAHDWQIFEPSCNLINVKEKWNERNYIP